MTPFASVFNKTAIWSMNAPVPPAQLPFMRCSNAPSKNVILASSPPNSMATSVSGITSSTVRVHAITSWTNGISKTSARPIPPDPVMLIVIPWVSIIDSASRNTRSVAVFTSEKWRSYFENMLSFCSFKMTNLTVVEPTSIPARNVMIIPTFHF